MPPQFSQQFEEDIKEEIKQICLNMSTEESQRKKKELLASLEAEKQLLLTDHEEKAEKIKNDQRDLARIHQKGVEVEEKIQQLKSGVFAPAEEPKKKVIFKLQLLLFALACPLSSITNLVISIYHPFFIQSNLT